MQSGIEEENFPDRSCHCESRLLVHNVAWRASFSSTDRFQRIIGSFLYKLNIIIKRWIWSNFSSFCPPLLHSAAWPGAPVEIESRSVFRIQPKPGASHFCNLFRIFYSPELFREFSLHLKVATRLGFDPVLILWPRTPLFSVVPRNPSGLCPDWTGPRMSISPKKIFISSSQDENEDSNFLDTIVEINSKYLNIFLK